MMHDKNEDSVDEPCNRESYTWATQKQLQPLFCRTDVDL